MFKKIIKIISFVIIFCQQMSFAEILNTIEVKGNNKISINTIKQKINFVNKKNYSLEDLNLIQKTLFDTEFFEQVTVKTLNSKLIIEVVENPFIESFFVKGVLNKKREEYFYDNLSLGQNRIFSEALLKKDIGIIKKNFNDEGYFNAKVTPRISKMDGNVINLILDVDRGQKYNISNIFFIGEKFFSSSTLSDVVSSSKYGWWKFLSSSTVVNQKRIEYDISLLKQFYLDQGFYDIQISSSNIEFINENFANITYSINSGKKYFFKDYKISDENKIIPDKNLKKVRSIIEKNIEKNVYSVSKLNKIKNKINEYLNLSKVEFYNFQIFEEKTDQDKINLNIFFNKSKRRYVDLINVRGNSITEEKFIRHKLTFSEGDSLQDYKLKKSTDNLKSTGIFSSVKTSIENNSKETATVNINVEEQPTGSVSAGLGIGSAGSTVSTSLNEKNLFGKGINVNSSISVGTEKINVNVNTLIPDYKNTDNTLIVGAFATSVDYANAGYESSQQGGSLALKYDLYEDVSLTTGFGLERDNIDVNSSASQVYKDRKGTYNSIEGFYSISSDKRNSSFLPTSGHKVSFKQTLGIPPSDIPFLKNSISGSYYYPASEKITLNIKGGAETNNSLSDKDVKLSDRLFLSSSKLRGFESYGIGPKDGKDHIGGNYSYYSSISSTLPNPLPDKWNAKTILFLDAGNVWGVDFDEKLDSNKLRSSFGAAFEWVSPLGPISFTFAETLSSASGDKEENFNFVIGSVF